MKERIEDYTEHEFLKFVESFDNPEAFTEAEESLRVDHFRKITEHPRGRDLLYWPLPGEDDTAAGIVKTVKEWRAANGKPGFRQP